jgi:BirA family biotin operon repressor/biotin-[acetyl-CoA-carboxylase] ligase
MNADLVVDKLSIEPIRRHLVTETVGRHMYLFDQIPSTNAALRELATAGAQEGTVVLAETQSAGRGRMGQAWFSPPGLNLYVSVLLRPDLPLAAVPVLSFIASLALSDAVSAFGTPAVIKWPNDVLVEDRKVAGCLVEVAERAGRLDHVILGVGINLNVPARDLNDTLGAAALGAGSLSELAGHTVDRNLFTATFLNFLESWLRVYGTDGPRAVLAAWRRRDVLIGQDVEIRGHDGTYRGWVLGVADDGYLLVEDSDGVCHRLVTEQIRPLASTRRTPARGFVARRTIETIE